MRIPTKEVFNVSKRRKRCYLVIGVAIFALLVLWMIWGNTALELNTYTITEENLPEAFDGFRIAHISDLHNTEIGRNNERLLAMLQQAQPDMIAITGDMIDSRRTDIAVALHFAEEAMKIAPCYYVAGNHESRVSAYDTLKTGLAGLGVTVLEDAAVPLQRGSGTITLTGVLDPAFQTDDLSGDPRSLMEEKLQELADDASCFTLLLSHRPELFDVYADAGMDLVLSGHAHGGQFRLPFVGGLFAPGQGFFPTYDAGLYTQGRTRMIVSRGIGNSILPLRFNNRPEVILIELKIP